MKEHQRALLNLIAKSQFGGVDETFEFATDIVDWNAVYDEAFNQSVIGIVAPEIPAGIYSSDEKWSNTLSQFLAINLRYFHAQNELTKLLEESNIPFVILKGTSAAIYYKHPERRAMGDIDFIVPQNQFEEAKKLLVDNDYVVADEKPFDPNAARHIGFHKKKLSYELHHHYSHNDIDMESYVIDGIEQRVKGNIESCEFPMLPRLANGLVILEHMKNHLRSGLGLRQVIDWMMYVYRELPDDYWEKEFASAVRSIGLEKFAVTATRMCQLYLGLPESITWCMGADEEVCGRLIDIVFASGNFGSKNGIGNAVESVATNIKTHGLFGWLQSAGEHNWEAYKKHPSLKPFCWAYQICRYAKKGFAAKRSVRKLSGDFDRSRERYKLLDEMGLLFEKQ